MKFNFRLVLFSVLALLIFPARDADPACDLQYLWHAQGRIVKTLGVELSENAQKGLAKVISKMDPQDLYKNQHGFSVISDAARNMQEVAGSKGVNEFFENVTKLGDDIEGMDHVIKDIATPNNPNTYRHGIEQMRDATTRFPGENVKFEQVTGIGEYRLDTFVPGKAATEIKTVENWDNKLYNDLGRTRFFQNYRKQAVSQAKFANSKKVPYEYIIHPPFPANTSDETIEAFVGTMRTEWADVINECKEISMKFMDSNGKILWSK